MKDFFNNKVEGPITSANNPSTNFPQVTAELRKLTVTASSVLLYRFDQTLTSVNKSSLVQDMMALRNKGFNAHHFISMVKRRGDPVTDTVRDKARFMCYGSPALRFVYSQLHTYVLPSSSSQKPRKLLLCEDVPLTAQFWEIACNLVYVECATLHSGLSDKERVDLVNRFNDPEDSLTVLIIMHTVSAQGVNLDKCCNRVMIMTNASNAPLEWQAWGRVIRVYCLLISFIPI